MTSVCVGSGCAVLPTEPIRYPSARSLSACADAAPATPPPLSTTTSVSARVSCGAPTGVACCGCTAARATFSTAAARTWCATDLPTIVTPIATSATSSRAASAEATIVAVRHRETWREGAYVCSTGRTHSCRGLALLRSAARSSSRSWRPAGRASAGETVQLARPRRRSCGQRGEAAPEAGSAGREETPARDVRAISSTRMFVTFEGIDGSGKTTQAELLAAALAEEGRAVVATREPGGTKLGERIRDLLLGEFVVSPWAETALFSAARAQLVDEVIHPALRDGGDVVCDRYIDSSLAYQGIARDLGVDRVLELNLQATRGLLPDRTFLVLVDPATALARSMPSDRIEREGEAFHRAVDEAYRALAALFPNRIETVD